MLERSVELRTILFDRCWHPPITKTWSFNLDNRGNVPVEDVVVTDTIPDTIDITRIRVPRMQGTPSGLNDTITVEFLTNLNGSWQATSGSPYDGLSSQWIDVSDLGLGTGEYITSVRWDFGTIPVGYKERDMQLRGTVMTSKRNGLPVAVGDNIRNTASITYRDFTQTSPRTGSDWATIPVRTVRPVADLDKNVVRNRNVDDGGTVTFSIRLLNHPLAAQELRQPVLADLLDERFRYVDGSAVVTSTAGAPAPIFEEIDDYNGTGQTLVRWSWNGASAYDIPIDESITIEFDVEVPRGTRYGNINNNGFLVDWANPSLDPYNRVNSRTDSNDLDGDGDTTETVYSERTTVRVNGRASMDSVKWVIGQLDTAESKFPDSGWTVPGGLANYRLVIENTGNVPIEDARILDMLPIIGDTGVVDLSPRESGWTAALAGPVTAPAGVKVSYSREANPERPDFQDPVPGAKDPLWSTTPPATITQARSLHFEFDGVVIQPGESFELSWPMRAPVGTPTDQGLIAWNSFGYLGTREDTGSTLLASEPNKVGIQVMPDNNASYGDYVWLDLDQDGIQDAREPGVNGIRVDFYEDGNQDGFSGGFANGVRDPAEDRHVGFTVTADDFSGNPGYYLFPDLDRGDYYAVFSVPDSYTITTTDAGNNDELDSDADLQEVDGNIIQAYMPITNIAAQEHDRSWDLGLWLPRASVDIVKTAGTAPDGEVYRVSAGSPVTYSFLVTNTGELPLVRLEVTDDILGGVDIIDGPLAPGESVTVTKTATSVDEDVINIGFVVGHPASPTTGLEIPGAPPVTANDPAMVTVYTLSPGPNLTLTKTGRFFAEGGACQPLGIANEFNALIFGNFNATGGDTDARLAVAGDAVINGGYSVGYVMRGDPLPTFTGGTTDIFITGGDLVDGVFGVNGNVVHEGTRTGPFRFMIDGNLVRDVTAVTFDEHGNVPSDGSGRTFEEIEIEMQTRSRLMAALPERGVVAINEIVGATDVIQLDLVGDDPVLNIFHLNDEQLSVSSAAISITVPDGATTLVNVHGDEVTISGASMSLSHDDPRLVLFNLVDATSLNLTSFDVKGSVLAPYASGDFSGGAIDGRSIFGGDVTTKNGFEFHNFRFNGGLCFFIEYDFVVENLGSVTITDIAIDDPTVSVLGGPIDLAPGEIDENTFTATYELQPSDVLNGVFVNEAIVSGLSPDNVAVLALATDTQTFEIPEIQPRRSSYDEDDDTEDPGSGDSSSGDTDLDTTPPDFVPGNPPSWMKPDFVLQSVVLEPSPSAAEDRFGAVIRIFNQGDLPGVPGVLAVWSGNSVYTESPDSEPDLAIFVGDRLNVGETVEVTVTNLVAPESTGTYHTMALINFGGDLSLEKSPGNNHSGATYTLHRLPNALNNSAALGSDWFYSLWFGYFASVVPDWVFSQNFGFVYVQPEGEPDSVWFYSP